MSYPFNPAVGKPKCDKASPPTSYASRTASPDRHSLLFDPALDQRLEYEFQGTTPLTKWYFSAAIKRTTIGIVETIFSDNATGAGGPSTALYFDSGDKLVFKLGGISSYSVSPVGLKTIAAFRDTNAWYHIYVESNQGTLAIYVNGKPVTTTTLSVDSGLNNFGKSGNTFCVGKHQDITALGGLRSYVTMVALTSLPSNGASQINDSGEFDTVTGEWVPKDVSVSFARNGGFYLSGKNELTNDFSVVTTREGNGRTSYYNNLMVNDKPDFLLTRQVDAPGEWFLYDSVKEGSFNHRTASIANPSTKDYIKLIDGGFSVSDNIDVNGDGEEFLNWAMAADPSKGFNVIRYTGNGGNRQLVHGGNKRPAMVWVKPMIAGNLFVWLDGYGQDNTIMTLLDSTPVSASYNNWYNAGTDDTTFGLANALNSNGIEYVAYIFWNSDDYLNIKRPHIRTDATSHLKFFEEGGVLYGLKVNAAAWSIIEFNEETCSFTNKTSGSLPVTNTIFNLEIVNAYGNIYALVSYWSTASTGGTLLKFNTATKRLDFIQALRRGEVGKPTHYTYNNVTYVVTAPDGFDENNPIVYRLDQSTQQLLQHQVLPSGGFLSNWHSNVVDGTTYVFGYDGVDGNAARDPKLYTANASGLTFIEELDNASYNVSAGLFNHQDTLYVMEGRWDTQLSRLWELNSSDVLVERQSFPKTPAVYNDIWETIEVDGASYGISNTVFAVNVKRLSDVNTLTSMDLYVFNQYTKKFEPRQRINAYGISDVSFVTFNNKIYVCAISTRNRSGQASNVAHSTMYVLNPKTQRLELGGISGDLQGVIARNLSVVSPWGFYYNLNTSVSQRVGLGDTNAAASTTDLSIVTPHPYNRYINIPETLDVSGLNGNITYIAIKDNTFLKEMTDSTNGTEVYPVNLHSEDATHKDSPFNNMPTFNALGGDAQFGISPNRGELSDGNLVVKSSTTISREVINAYVPSDTELYFEYTILQVASSSGSGSTSLITEHGEVRYESSSNSFGLTGQSGRTLNRVPDEGDVVGIYIKEDNSWEVHVNGSNVHSIPSNKPFGRHIIFTKRPNQSISVNFGQRPFVYPPASSSFRMLSAATLSEAQPITLPSNYFVKHHWTGTTTTPKVIPDTEGFDIALLKRKDATSSWRLYFKEVGGDKVLYPNTSQRLTNISASSSSLSFSNSGDIFLSSAVNVPVNDGQMAGYFWKADHCSGMCVKYYVGNGSSGLRVTHGLSKKPDVVIIKQLTDSNTSWIVNFRQFTTDAHLSFETDGHISSNARNIFSGNEIDNTYLTLGDAGLTNSAGKNYLLWSMCEVPGFSKFGLYRGNGSTGGPFIHCGFKPSLVIIKYATSNGDWFVYDDHNSADNPVGIGGRLNAQGVNGGIGAVDFVSNGFKIRTSNDSINFNGVNVSYMAFAALPFAYANAK